MDCRTGEVIGHEDYKKLNEIEKSFFIDISREALSKQFKNEDIGVDVRKKGSMRNKPCPCGSGKKYKKCCLLARV